MEYITNSNLLMQNCDYKVLFMISLTWYGEHQYLQIFLGIHLNALHPNKL